MSNDHPVRGAPRGRPPTRVTREETARILNTSVENVRNLERRGYLRAFHDQHGAARYDRQVVDALRRRRQIRGKDPSKDAELVKLLFAMFRQDLPLDVIVDRTGLLPDEIGRVYRMYLGGLNLWDPRMRPRGRPATDITHSKRLEAEIRLASRQQADIAATVRRYAKARESRIAVLLAQGRKPLKGKE